MSILERRLFEDKQKKLSKGLFRKVSCLSQNKDFTNFSSNDYLSLTNDTNLKNFYQNGYKQFNAGSTGSIVISGYTNAHRDLDKYISEIFNVDGCLLFSSGYIANLSVVSLLANHNAKLLIDKSVHASIYDGIKLSGISYDRYLHNNLNSLQKKLANNSAVDLALITESIFSMSGERADLSSINNLVKLYKGTLIVDEAHAFGVVGSKGLGAVDDACLNQEDVPLRIIPLGKACAGFGSLVIGKKLWLESLLQTRQAVYSTAVSPAVAHGILASIEYIITLDERRQKLQNLISMFRVLQNSSHLKWRDSKTHIQQLQLGCPHLATKVSDGLFQSGIICLPIRTPTVSTPETGLRVILNYQHEERDLIKLFSCLDRLLL